MTTKALLFVAIFTATLMNALCQEINIENIMSVSLSGCRLCEQTGMCDHAFRNQPGQFCHTLVSGQPCCCPPDAQCVANIYSCRCSKTFHNQPTVRAEHHSSASTHTILIILIGMLLCVVCCWCLSSSTSHRECKDPVCVGTTDYGTSQYQYVYPAQSQFQNQGYSYGNVPQQPQVVYAAPVVYERDNSSAGSAFAAGAAGAVAGLATGALLQSAFNGGGHRDQGYQSSEVTYEFAGDSGDYGGGDDGGDFGGDA